MATFRGCLGKVFSAATSTGSPLVIGEVRNWQFEETAERKDASAMGTCAKKYVAGAIETSGQVQVWWDDADARQSDFVAGNTVGLELYPAGDGSGETYYKTAVTATGGAVVTSRQVGGDVDGIVEQTFGFSVNGGFTTTTVP
jgi:hypothetical protein